MRTPGWEGRLKEVVEKHRGMPGKSGVSDCWMLAMDSVEAVTGSRILTHLQKYKSEAGGYRAFHKCGFTTVEEALASVLPRENALLGQRGDLATLEINGVITCGVFVSMGIAVKMLFGETVLIKGRSVDRMSGHDLQIFPATSVRSAFLVR